MVMKKNSSVEEITFEGINVLFGVGSITKTKEALFFLDSLFKSLDEKDVSERKVFKKKFNQIKSKFNSVKNTKEYKDIIPPIEKTLLSWGKKEGKPCTCVKHESNGNGNGHKK
jgi:hypothetical protein